MPPTPLPHLAQMAPYEWEASAEDVARAAGIPESEVVRFDMNTVAWPPVAWEQTVLDLPRLPANEYPHPSNDPLRTNLARKLGVVPERVMVTNGADEALYYVAAAYLAPGRRAVLMAPSFSMFRVVSQTFGADMIDVPADDNWDTPPDLLLRTVEETQPAVVWLCSPNNPTGRLLDADTVEAVARRAPETLVVLDEAYYEVAGVTLAHLLDRVDNLLLVRTFSKGYGLAGARVGYAVGSLEVVSALDKARLPQNLSAFALAAATRALADEQGLAERVAQIRAERDRLQAALEQRGWQIVPSHANFLLGRPPRPAADLARWLQGGGLVVRSYASNPRLKDSLRVSVRAPHEDDRLLARLDAF